METVLNKFTCNDVPCNSDDLFINHNIPNVKYDSIPMQQRHDISDAFNKLIKFTKPKRVIEIGTADGGLTLLLRDLLNNNELNDTDLYTYDIRHQGMLISKVNEQNLNIQVKHEDIFNEDHTLKNEELIKNFIQGEGTTIILCDGGDKINEFKTLSKYLKKGDMIMAHDYSYDREYYDKHIHNKIWYWLEIQNSDIEQTCYENSLLDLMVDDFNKVVWCCKIKV